MDYIFLFIGLAGLLAGGEALVRGAVGIAGRLGMPPLLIGLTVVGFGTSTPELLVSIEAALRGVPEIAIGNIVGSNIGNVLLIAGLSALVWPIQVTGETLRRDTTVMLLASIVLFAPFAMGQVGRMTGIILFTGLMAYLIWAYRSSKNGAKVAGSETAMPVLPALFWVVAGILALVFGARFLVDGAVSIAREFGISEAFIGLTVVAVGTSLPELATSLVAAFRRQSEIAIGNIVGSNIFNVLGILGLTAIISPIPVASRFLRFDLPVMVAVSMIFTVLLLRWPVIGRAAGLGMLATYALYVWSAQS